MKSNTGVSLCSAITRGKAKIGLLHTLNQEQSLVKNWFWVVLFFFYLIYFVSYIYTDIIYTTFSSINFWNSLFAGKVWDFHSFSGNSLYSSTVFLGMGEHPVAIYPLPLYLVFAVWDFPLWIADRFFGIDVFASFGCLLWIKLMLVLFLATTTKALYRLCLAVKIQSRYIMPSIFLFLSSYMVMSPILATTQYDIISLTFLLFGLLEFFNGNKRRYYVYFSISVSMKLFALFVIIPVFLLREKRVSRLVKSFFLMCLPTALFYLFIAFTTRQDAIETMSISNGMISRMLFSSQLDLGFIHFSLFPAAFVTICIYCYAKQPMSSDILPVWSVYTSAAGLSAFFLFSPAHPYWIILLVPFVTILTFIKPAQIKMNLILLFIINGGLSTWQGITYYWCYDTSRVDRMLPALLFPLSKQTDLLLSTKDAFALFFPSDLILSVSFTLFATGLASYLLLNKPQNYICTYSQSLSSKEETVLLVLNAALSISITAIPLLMYLYIAVFK